VHLSERSFRVSSQSSRTTPKAARHARKKKKKKKRLGSGCKNEAEEKEGTRIWPLQLEERGKAEVANPCKEPLYFLKEVLRAPDALSPARPDPVRKDRSGPHSRVRSSLFFLSLCRPRVTATRAARFQHVSTTTTTTTATWEGSRVRGRRVDPIHYLSSFLRRGNGGPAGI